MSSKEKRNKTIVDMRMNVSRAQVAFRNAKSKKIRGAEQALEHAES